MDRMRKILAFALALVMTLSIFTVRGSSSRVVVAESDSADENSTDDNLATIILKAEDVMLDGETGYQLILDKDHNTELIFGEDGYNGGVVCDGSLPDDIIGQFEYKIPTDFNGAPHRPGRM